MLRSWFRAGLYGFSTMSSPSNRVDISDRLVRLRKLMKEHNIHVYVIPSEDAHQSEYIAPCDARRAYISGFDGSAGTAVITLDSAALATDGRYFNQASKQLDSNWQLLKQGLPNVPTWSKWASDKAKDGKNIGVDARVIREATAKALKDQLKEVGGGELIGQDFDLVDLIWKDRPPRPNNPLLLLDEKFSGRSSEIKIKDLRETISQKKGLGFIVTALDEIAWLFNLRGTDIPFNPVFFSYAIITPDLVQLFVDPKKVTSDLKDFLPKETEILPYDSFFDKLQHLSAQFEPVDKEKKPEADSENVKKFLVSKSCSWALYKAVGADKIEAIRSPIEDAKAIKNETEINGMKNCHIRDGVAQIKYFSWLEEKILAGDKLNEVTSADELERQRNLQKYSKGLSFTTISASGPNAAVIHYKPEVNDCRNLSKDEVYLCDSGGQYLDGTTDVTRTLHFGTPSKHQMETYTLVLKGHIALAKAIFPTDISGSALDSFARQFLWNYGLDYRHGTGHGVGSFLNVHEGPMGIGSRPTNAGIKPGQIISNEPGYYKDKEFGIRIESLVLVKVAKTPYRFSDKDYLEFHTITLVPLCKKLIDVSLLTDSEIEWIDAYHKEVLGKTSKFVQDDARAIAWLKRETSPLR